MSNTITATVEQLLRESIPLQRPAQPNVALYCTPMYLPGPVVGGKSNIPVVDSVQAVQTNPTTFENSGDVISLGQATLVHLSSQFGLLHSEADQGLELRLLLASHLTNLEKAIQAQINAIITEANYSSAVVTALSSAFTVANLETLRAAVPSATIVALGSAYFAKTKSTWMPAGEESTVKEFSNTTSIGTNVVGFAARPESVALIIGWPRPGPKNEVTSSQITLPIGVPVLFSRWFSRGGRQFRGSLDVVIGVEVGQPGAMKLIKSA